jgi:hypothetical protein
MTAKISGRCRDRKADGIFGRRSRGQPGFLVLLGVCGFYIFPRVGDLGMGNAAFPFQHDPVLDDQLRGLDIAQDPRRGKKEDAAGGADAADHDSLDDHARGIDIGLDPAVHPDHKLVDKQGRALEFPVNPEIAVDCVPAFKKTVFVDP